MKQINSFLNVSARLLLALTISVTLFSSCASQYHWVKAKSADPHFAAKSDNYATAIARPDAAGDKVQAEVVKPSSSLATASGQTSTGMATASAGGDDLESRAELKASEIRSALSVQRKEALSSADQQVRKQAIRETVHEQLAILPGYNKLPESKKLLIENKITSKTAKMSNAAFERGGSIEGFNRLLLVGIILLAIGLILAIVGGAVGDVLGTILLVIGLVLAILGLVQMLG